MNEYCKTLATVRQTSDVCKRVSFQTTSINVHFVALTTPSQQTLRPHQRQNLHWDDGAQVKLTSQATILFDDANLGEDRKRYFTGARTKFNV